MGDMKKKLKVLMTGAGAPGGPGIIRCLQLDDRIDLIVGDADQNASGRHLNSKFVLLPSARDTNFIEKILDICQSMNVDVIFPLVTLELFKFSEAKDLFKSKNIDIIVSDSSSLQIANDKVEVYQHCKKIGLPIPSFLIATNPEELIYSVKALGYPSVPVVIKPGISNGSRGIRILDESKDRFNLFMNEKPNSMLMTLGDLATIIVGQKLPKMMVSEYMPGEEVTVDTIVENSNVKLILVRTRDKMNGGISVAGRFIEDNAVRKQVFDIVESLGLDGPIGLQFKKDKNGIFKLLEINPRIQGTSVSAMGLGINLPLIAISQTCGWKWDIPKKLSGIGFVRYYSELYYEA
jgi:carbamoyl-phosphate synthase large subunit